MNQNLSTDIKLRYSMRVPVKRGGADIVPAKIFVPIAAVVLYWLTQKYSLIDQAIILVGCAVVPVSVYIFMRGLQPLTLFANGNVSVPSSVSPTARLIRRSEIKSFADMPYESLALIGEGEQVLTVIRPANFKNHQLFHHWFTHHYGNLPKTTVSSRNIMIRPEKQQVGSIKFFIVAAILLGLVAYNIFLAVTGSSY